MLQGVALSTQGSTHSVDELKNQILSDPNPEVRRVGTLFLDLGFIPVAHGLNVHNVQGQRIGEIDLAFKLERDASLRLLIIEVSRRSRDPNEKISSFFSKWADPSNLQLLLQKLDMTGLKNFRIYVDAFRESKTAVVSSVRHHLENSTAPNRLLFKDDIEYFEEMFAKIGRWARSDLLSLIRVPMSETFVRRKAIQFYLGNTPAFSLVMDVRTLLDCCYVSRRLGEKKGYQRVLSQERIRTIGKEIEAGRMMAFPNSILIDCEQPLTDTPLPPEECPREKDIALPTSYCSCCVVDGQHRLLGFSQVRESELAQRHLPVIAFQQLDPSEETKLFIDINSKQKRIDSNLILDLKADFSWNPVQNPREHAEKIIVMIARRLNTNGPLRQRIFFGGAREKRGMKITLSTIVSIIRENQLVGGKWHFYQRDPNSTDIGEPFQKIKSIFSSMLQTFHRKADSRAFLLSNVGLRILFRTIHVLERNRRSAKRFRITNVQFFEDLKRTLDDRMIGELEKLYGTGGKVEGSKRVIDVLKRDFPERYKPLELDFRRLRVKK